MRSRVEMGLRLRSCALVLVLLGLVACGGGGGGGGSDPTPTRRATPTRTATVPTPTVTGTPGPTATPTEVPCDLPLPFCGGSFPLNRLLTTPYGPSWANVVLQPQDFVTCFGPYALCFYADCTVLPDGVSVCPCFEWYGTNFVDINAIMNLDSYLATKSQCDADPNICRQPNGAQVCADLITGSFLPSAQRFSTFSFYRAEQEPIGSTDCADEAGPYAGCMTAPCFGPALPDPSGRAATIQCECPIWDGPFQLGKDDLTCDASPKVWSAAYNPNPPSPDPCDRVSGACIPDAPYDECGCPLFDPGQTVLPPDSGVDCNVVCQEYAGCVRDPDIQLGFTCDATLCTSRDHDLVFDACLGLERCALTEIFKAESAAGCSCCASQLCGCTPNLPTDARIARLNTRERATGDTPQCDINGTLCGAP